MFSEVVVFVCLVAVFHSVALQEQVPILSESNEVNPDGSFHWQYQSGDGSAQQQSGELKQLGQDFGEVVQGSASWTDPEGGRHQLSYVADENGYQPESADLPVPPEIPSAILRSLEWTATKLHRVPEGPF